MSVTLDLLILGAGWTSNFLIPLCRQRQVSYAATTRSGSVGTYKFVFDQDGDEESQLEQFKGLPDATTVLITFPITKKGASTRLVSMYNKTHKKTRAGPAKASFIQLGTTSIWDGASRNHITASQASRHQWYDRHSPYISNERSSAEDELLALAPDIPLTVLNLSGLWGGQRDTRNWVGRVAPTKDALKNKGSIHMIHGHDVARAILAVHAQFSKAAGQRWLLTDGRVYDWWDLASAWGLPSPQGSAGTTDTNDVKDSAESAPLDSLKGPQPAWVIELMLETGVRALPRDISLLGRALDSREFWHTFGLMPERSRLDKADL